jgi:hypothetical protein
VSGKEIDAFDQKQPVSPTGWKGTLTKSAKPNATSLLKHWCKAGDFRRLRSRPAMYRQVVVLVLMLRW